MADQECRVSVEELEHDKREKQPTSEELADFHFDDERG